MESFAVRYRNLLVLLAVLVVQIVGLAMQVHRVDAGHVLPDPGDSRGVRLIRLWANAVVEPPERLIHSSKLGVQNFWQNYADLRNVRQQNKDLEKTVDRMRLEQAALLEDARQGQRLQSLLGFQEKYAYKTIAAQVVGSSGTTQAQVFYIDKGADAKLERDMAVITPDGIVGKVREVFPHSAQVLAINDQSSGAGVILEKTRTRGILRGNAQGRPQIVGIVSDNRIQPGENVLTAGGDQIFPRGLAVGVVDHVERDPDHDGFIHVIVKPAAHLDQLDEVLVITAADAHLPPDQQQDLATSETLKGPEVEAEKRKASQIMGERLPGLIDPNLPADQQPLNDDSNPNSVGHVAQPLHPDRFSPVQDGQVPAGTQPSKPAKPAAAPPSSSPAAPGSSTPTPAKPGGQTKPSLPKPSLPKPGPSAPARTTATQPRRNP